VVVAQPGVRGCQRGIPRLALDSFGKCRRGNGKYQTTARLEHTRGFRNRVQIARNVLQHAVAVDRAVGGGRHGESRAVCSNNGPIHPRGVRNSNLIGDELKPINRPVGPQHPARDFARAAAQIKDRCRKGSVTQHGELRRPPKRNSRLMRVSAQRQS